MTLGNIHEDISAKVGDGPIWESAEEKLLGIHSKGTSFAKEA